MATLGATFSGASASRGFLIDVWRFDDDLPRDGINSIAQGSDGYLWVSSRYGLARFDGVRFADFSARVSAQFLGYHYANLLPDRSGAVWIGTPGGGLLQWREGHLVPCVKAGNPVFGPVCAGLTNTQGRGLAVAPDGRVLGWSNGVMHLVADASRWGGPVPASICQGQEGSIWFVTYQHNLVRVQGTNPQEMVYGTGDARRNWIALQAAARGELWAGTQRGVGIWQGNGFQPVAGPVEPFPVDDIIAVPPAVPRPGSASQGEESRLWVVALGRAWLLEGTRWITNVLYEPSTGAYETSPRIADKEGNLWFTTAGISIARAGVDGGLTLLGTQDGVPPGRLAALYQDREGSIWAGIEHAGLVRLRERHFEMLASREAAREPLIWAVVEDSTGAIWLGTEHSGLHRLQEGKFSQFELGPGGLAGSVYSLCLDQQHVLWAGTGDKGVFRFEDGRFLPVWEFTEPGWNRRVYVIYQDRRGQMWFGTGMGLFCWDKGKARRVAGKGFDMGVVRAIAEDVGGRLWFGLSAGAETRLAWLESDALVGQGAHEGLVGHDIFGLHPDPDGAMWIGTVGDGLWRWREGVFSRYGTVEGLPDERIYSIEEDRAGDLWLGSPAGIFQVSKSAIAALDAERTNRLDCLRFDRTDGLPTRECSGGSQPSIYRARDGRLLFALEEGAVAVAPERIRVNPLPPPVLIEEVRVDGKPVEIQPEHTPAIPPSGSEAPRHTGPTLSLGPGRHVIEFRYTATSLIAPAKVRFKHRLEGVEKQWREADAARTATYSLAVPGEYQFRVTGCNNDGVWNETAATVALTLAPYFWQTWWFRSGGVLSILLVVGGSVRFVERRKLQRRLAQLEMQQTVERERMRIARDIHDELGASLTEIGLLSEFAQRDSAPAEQIKQDVGKIAVKAQSSTRALDEIVWAVNPRHDTVDGFVSYACAYAEEQLRMADIRCRLEAPSPLPPRLLRADRRHHLFLAFKEALSNILKHARASQVEVRLQVKAERLTVQISDNGCGFAYNQDQARSSAGNGLINMKERLESVGGGFECESAPGRGTCVTLMVKLD